MGNNKPKTITKDQYYKLLGLLMLANDLEMQRDNIMSATANILQLEGTDDYDKGGYVISDIASPTTGKTALLQKLKDCNVKIK